MPRKPTSGADFLEASSYVEGGVGFKAALLLGAVASLVLFFVPVITSPWKTLNTPVGFILRDTEIFYAPLTADAPSGTPLDIYAYPDPALGAQVAEVPVNDLYKYGKGLVRLPMTDTVFAATANGYLAVETFAHMWLPVDSLLRFSFMGLFIASVVVLAMWWWWEDNTKKYGSVFHLGVETAYGSIRAICTALETVALFGAVGIHNVVTLSVVGLQFGVIELLYLLQRRVGYSVQRTAEGYAGVEMEDYPSQQGRTLKKQKVVATEDAHMEHQTSFAWLMLGLILSSFVYWAVRVHNYGSAYVLPAGWEQWTPAVHYSIVTIFYVYMLVRFAPMLTYCLCVLMGDSWGYMKYHFFLYVVMGMGCTLALWATLVTHYNNTIDKLAADGL